MVLKACGILLLNMGRHYAKQNNSAPPKRVPYDEEIVFMKTGDTFLYEGVQYSTLRMMRRYELNESQRLKVDSAHRSRKKTTRRSYSK